MWTHYNLIVRTPLKTKFTISNVGTTGFYYSWIFKDSWYDQKLKIEFKDENGFVASQMDTETMMIFMSLTKTVLKKLKIKLEIRYGPTYLIQLAGTVSQILFNFSVNEYDFGPCLVQKGETSYNKTTIDFTNTDDKPVTLECKLPIQNYLAINFKSKQIEAKKSQPLVLRFFPQEVKHYYTEIQFYINSTLHVIKVYGRGVLNSLRLKNPNDKFLDLGCPLIGKSTKTMVEVINDSAAVINVIFDICDRLPYFARPKKMLTSDYDFAMQATTTLFKKRAKSPGRISGESEKKKSEKGKANLKDNVKQKKNKVQMKTNFVKTVEMKERQLVRSFITFSPNTFIKILPRHSAQFFIQFAPTERIKMFSEKVSYQVQDIIETLCEFRGCCRAPEFVLDKTVLPFGNITIGCQRKQKLILNNTGDLGGKFKWMFEKPQLNYIITPQEGYISSKTVVTFLVKFEPKAISCMLEEKPKCHIENLQHPLELILTGSCFDMSTPKETIKFSCSVRTQDVKYITITNSTDEEWSLTPEINGKYFYTRNTIIIPPHSTIECEVYYRPLMSTRKTPHHAKMFFNLPDGKDLLYKFIGTTLAPLPLDKIYREIKCKEYYSEILPIKNWLSSSQVFDVTTELISTSSPKSLFKLTGNDKIDVLAHCDREYTWTIFVLNEGTLTFNVVFKNSCTHEYLFYEITLVVLKSPALEVVSLTSNVRVPVHHTLTLANPIKNAVTFTVKQSHPELSCDSVVKVPPFSQTSFVITYKPLAIGQTECCLEIFSPELGLYPYEMILTAHPPPQEPCTYFKAYLGQCVSQKAYIYNDLLEPVQFTTQTESAFATDKFISVGPCENHQFEIWFEPEQIGNIQSTLILNSPRTGSYLYPLTATCDLPKPQGPYFITPGGNITITFKNPFKEIKLFNFIVEPAIFGLKSKQELVESKGEYKIIISLLPYKNLEILIDKKYPLSGKLTIYCAEKELSSIKWIYYLQGDTTD